MKTFKTLLCISALALCCGSVAFAQEDGNRDENGKIVRGPYLTNTWKDNWFIGVGGGINVAVDGLATKADPTYYGIGGAVDAFVGKWFTPCWGARLGYQGLFTRMDDGVGENKNKAPFNYIHGDLLWNLSNQFGGYKESRIYNAIGYVHAGYLGDIIRKEGKQIHGQEFGVGCGLINNFQLHKRVNLYIDLRCLLTRAEQFRTYTNGTAGMFSALAGLSFNLGKTNWSRASSATGVDDGKLAALEAANKALEEAKDALAKKNDDLAKENEDAAKKNKALADKCDSLSKLGGNEIVKWMKSLFEGPVTVYFDLGQTELSGLENEHLDRFVSIILANDDKATFYLTGSADSSTGTPEDNMRLADSRVKTVAGILKNTYNIPEDRIVVRDSIINDDTNAPELGRSVIIDTK